MFEHSVTRMVVRGWRGIGWYLRELTGETAYERYLEHHASRAHDEHHSGLPMTRREFERQRAERSAQPGGRCC